MMVGFTCMFYSCFFTARSDDFLIDYKGTIPVMPEKPGR